MAAVLLHLIEPASIEPAWASSMLTPEELERADRFVFPADARRWSCVRAETRRLLADHLGLDPRDLRWDYAEHEKPSIAGHNLHFNLSHGDTLSALAIAPLGPVGIDLEPRKRGADLVADLEAFCHPDEIRRLPEEGKDQALIELWTAKEAFLKALGTGLSQPPEQVCIDGAHARGPLAGFDSLHLLRPEHPRLEQHAIAIAAPPEILHVEVAPPRP